MPIGAWDTAVRFERSKGDVRTVASTEEAAGLLLRDWPLSTGKQLFWARGICLDAVAGLKPHEEARAAFVVACEEAGISVRLET